VIHTTFNLFIGLLGNKHEKLLHDGKPNLCIVYDGDETMATSLAALDLQKLLEFEDSAFATQITLKNRQLNKQIKYKA
jgi:hypothetical protein